MRLRNALIVVAAASAAFALPASAAIVASATTPLNIRSGPGPQYAVIGFIPDRGQTTITGCIQGSLWCQVSFNGKQGWAYSQYLTATLSGRSLAVAEMRDIPPVTYQAPATTVGSAVPAPIVTETLVAPQPRAPLAITPPPQVGGYIVSHPVTPAYLNGEVVVGAGVPEDVVLSPVPGSDYDYAYLNSQPVLVKPSTRQVVYVYR